MNKEISQIIHSYQKRELSKEEFKKSILNTLINFPTDIKNLFDEIEDKKNGSDLEDALTIFWVINDTEEEVEILNKLLIKQWHTRHEEIIHALQKRKSPTSIPFIKEALQIKFQYLEDYGTGTRQFINQCGHALFSIGTKEAIAVIYEFTKSSNPVLKDEMLYRISKITGENDYQRNYDIV